MKHSFYNNTLTIELDSRIDSGNSSDFQKYVEDSFSEGSFDRIVFDASSLTYISSAGLRVLLKTKKQTDKPVEIINVTRDVFDIFDTTGFTELLTVKKMPRKISVDGCEVIGKGFYGTVYRIDDDTIVKVYNTPDALSMIENEKRVAKLAFLSGIPTAISYDIVQVGDNYGSVFEMLKSQTFNDRIIASPEKADEIVREYVSFIKLVHDTDLGESNLPFAKDHFLGYFDSIDKYLGMDLSLKLKALIKNIPDTTHAVHGDIQMKNVMTLDGEPALIDMDTLSKGNPIFDLCGLYVTYQEFKEDEPNNTEDFLGISGKMADFIWKKILEYYYETDDNEILIAQTDRIRIVAGIRFLYLLAVTSLKDGELGQTRISHTVANLTELAGRVDKLV